MKKSILAVCLGLAGFWSVQAEDSPIADPERVNEQGDAELPSGELLSDHVAEAEFTDSSEMQVPYFPVPGQVRPCQGFRRFPDRQVPGLPETRQVRR